MDPDEAEAVWARQAEVHDDLERLEAASGDLPDLWTGIRFEGADIVVLVTDPARAAAELLPLVQHPDRVRFETAKHTLERLKQIHREALQILEDTGRPDLWTSHGIRKEVVDLALRSPEAALAQQLHDRFGDALALRLGAHPFPLRTPKDRGPRPHRSAPCTSHAPQTELDSAEVRSGDRFGGRVHVRNDGSEALQFDTESPAVAVVLDLDGQVVAGYVGAVAGVGYGLRLKPSEQASVPFIGGTDTINPVDGAVLAPGTYQISVPLRGSTEEKPQQRGTLVTPPTTLIIRPTIGNPQNAVKEGPTSVS